MFADGRSATDVSTEWHTEHEWTERATDGGSGPRRGRRWVIALFSESTSFSCVLIGRPVRSVDTWWTRNRRNTYSPADGAIGTGPWSSDVRTPRILAAVGFRTFRVERIFFLFYVPRSNLRCRMKKHRRQDKTHSQRQKQFSIFFDIILI